MDQETRQKYTNLMERRQIIQGRIKLTCRSEEFNSDIVLVDLKDAKAIIKKEDFDIRDVKGSFTKHIGDNVKFIITRITEDGQLICSRKIVKEYELDKLIELLNDNKEFEGRIVNIQKWGAFLDVKGTTVVLRNIDFAEDYTTIKDKHKVGDKINVKLLKVNKNKKILVQAVQKYCEPTAVNFDDFQEHQVVSGTIRTIKPFGCFVCIQRNLDVLTPVPELPTQDVEEGTKVLVKLQKVDKENKKIRGKIIRVIPDDLDFEFDD